MAWPDFVRLMDECLDADEFDSVVLDLQNEPTLDPDLERRIAYVRERQRRSVFVGITTNGLSLDAARFQSLVAAGIDRVVLSLNALDAITFGKLVPQVRFDRVLSNVQDVLSVPHAAQRLKLSFGATEGNIDQASKFIEHMEQQAIQYRVFAFHDRLKTLSGDFLKLQTSPLCHLPLYSMAVRLDGSAILCCQDWEPRRVLGNVLTSSVRTVWNNADYIEIRRALVERQELPNAPCSGCDAPYQLNSRVSFNHQEMHRIGLRFFDKSGSAANQSPLQVAPQGKGFLLHNGRTHTSVALDREQAQAVERLLHGEQADGADQLFAQQLIASELARGEQAPFQGRSIQIIFGDGVESSAILQTLGERELKISYVDAAQTSAVEQEVTVQIPLVERTLVLSLTGTLAPTEAPDARLLIDLQSHQALQDAIVLEGGWQERLCS